MIGVTGANGLLGSFIVRKLIDENAKFIAFKRKQADTSLLDDVGEKITWRELDLQDPVSMDDSLEGITDVIHAAARVSFNPRHRAVITEINTTGTRSLVDACLANSVRRFVHISSVGALGRVKGQAVIDEGNKWVENAMHTTYASSKYHAELEVFRGQEEGLKTVIVNPSVILAPADWTKSSAQLFRYVWQERPFYIDASLNYVDVRDVAAAVWALLNSGMENERIIVSAGALSFKAFFDAIALRFGKKPPMVRLNRNFLKIVAGIDSLRTLIGRSEPLITTETARLADSFFQYDNQKIKNLLNLEFHTLDDTIDWCCDHYMKNFAPKKG